MIARHASGRLVSALALLALLVAGCGRREEESPPPPAPAPRAAKLDPRLKVAAFVPPAPPVAPSAKTLASLPPGPPLGVTLTTTGPVWHATVLSSGIPFPRGQVASIEHLRLEGPGGAAIPAQFAPLAWWPDGSLKAVLLTAPVDASQAIQSFMLRSDPSQPAPPVQTALRVEEQSDAIVVTTGPTRFRVGRRRFALFDQAWADRNADGQFDDAEALLRGPGDLFLLKAGQEGEYRASADPKPEVVVEESGPVRAVIRASGWLRDGLGQPYTAFLVRITAFAGQEAVRVDYTLLDPREERDVEAHRQAPALEVAGYGLRLPVALGEPAQGLFGGDPLKGYQAFGGPLVPSQFLYQQGAFNYVDGVLRPFSFYYDGIAQGERADGWVDASDERGGVAAMVRRFWEQFPKELAIVDRDLIVYLHPPRATTEADVEPPGGWSKRYRRPKSMYFLREGGAKTYQLQFVFHRGQGDADALGAMYDTLQDGPRLMPSTAWMCRSGVFGDLAESGADTEGYDSNLLNGIYEPSIGSRRHTGSPALLYGWRDYGDRLRPGWDAVSDGLRIPAFYNDTHIGAHVFFIHYLRTGDLRWYELGEMASRHWMDLDVSHANRLGYWKRDGKPVGFGPGEGYLIKHDVLDHACRNLHLGHAHLSGLVEYYLLTGDQRAYQVIREVGDWWAKSAPGFFSVPISKPHWAEAERDFAWPLFVLNEAYRATGDAAYHHAAARIVRHLIEWWQTPSDHYVNGQVVGRNDPRQGTGWWAMYPRSDNSPAPPAGKTLYNGTNPWMAGALLSAVIKFHEADRDLGLVDDALTETMLLQCMNYVVKHGWNPERRFFIYSEAARDTDGGSTGLMYPLAYGWRRLQQGVEHPEWYDTAPLWREIAEAAYRNAGQGGPRGTTDAGFYGYETIFPADFFRIMQELRRAESAAPQEPAR
jgi:hypothetical protein